tara:strand:- start:28 stop:171 length:144 start_codon:yes stop_codon:yes gene_type:complete
MNQSYSGSTGDHGIIQRIKSVGRLSFDTDWRKLDFKQESLIKPAFSS